MKNLIVLAVAALFATNAVAAEMKWTGSTGWRYSETKNDDGLDSKQNTGSFGLKDQSLQKTRSHQFRANLGVMGGWENVEYGVGVRTGFGTNSDYTTFNHNADQAIGVEQAWFRYVRDFGSLEMAATIGRQKNALLTDNVWQTHFDNDVRWDGFGWNFKFGMFGFNAAQYIIGTTTTTAVGAHVGNTQGASAYSSTEATQHAVTGSKRFSTLFAFQPHMTWKFADEVEALFAAGYYKYNAQGFSNVSGGGVDPNGWNGAAGSVPAIASGRINMDNKAYWDFLINVKLPYTFNFVFNYVKSDKTVVNNLTATNLAGNALYAGSIAQGGAPEVSSKAYTLGLTYGKLRKAHDWMLGYSYGNKGLASTIGTLTNDKFAPDNQGHTIVAGYSLADNFNIGLRWMSLMEKERLNLSGAALVAGQVYASPNGSQRVSTKYWEITSGVAF